MTWARWILIFCLAALLYVVVGGAGTTPESFFHKSVQRNSSHSGTWEEQFRVELNIPRFIVNVDSTTRGGIPALDLTGEDGLWLLARFPLGQGSTRFFCGEDLPEGTYTVRLHEDRFVGAYSIEIGGRRGLTRWHRFLIALFSACVVSGTLYGSLQSRWAPSALRRWLALTKGVFVSTLIVILVLLLYLLLHEGGHALASLAFGAFDLRRSDFFGLWASPHAGLKPDANLADWQRATIAITGPILPTLVAYGLYGLWRSGWGNDFRERNPSIDLFWTMAIFALLLGYLGLVLPILDVANDGDYRKFVDHARLSRWMANTLLLSVALVNGWFLYKVVPHVLSLRRRWLADSNAA